MSWIKDKFLSLPLWGKVLVVLTAISMTEAIFVPNDEGIQGFFLESFARLAFFLYLIGTFSGAFYFGFKSSEKSGRSWLGWLVGITFFLLVGVGLALLIEEVPGIGPRFEQLMNRESNCYTDWDGRSNPTVCE